MKLKDFAKSVRELEREIEKNNKPVLQYDEKNRMARTNQTDYKLTTTVLFSLMSYLVLFVVSAISLSIFDTPLFTSDLPTLAYPVVILGDSVGLGTIARVVMEKKFKLKERMQAFTDAKTDTEKLVEEVKNEIELKKIENRNLALNRTIEKIRSDEKILRTVSDKYVINDKEEKSQEQSKEKVSSLMSLLKAKYAELDSLTTRKTISDKFFHQRQKGQSIMETIMAALGCGMGVMLYFVLTLMIAYTNKAAPLHQGIPALFTVFSPMVVGGVAAGTYFTIRNKKHTKAFNILNETLGDDSLPSKSDDTYVERQTLNNLINNTIKQIVDATVELQEERRYLESFSNIEPEEEPSKEPTITNDLVKVQQVIPAIEGDYPEASSFEEEPFEGITLRGEPKEEGRKLTLKRNKPTQEIQ